MTRIACYNAMNREVELLGDYAADKICIRIANKPTDRTIAWADFDLSAAQELYAAMGELIESIQRHRQTAGHTTKCYRVWFTDDSALLVDATGDVDAIARAQRLAFEQFGQPMTAAKVECLTK